MSESKILKDFVSVENKKTVDYIKTCNDLFELRALAYHTYYGGTPEKNLAKVAKARIRSAGRSIISNMTRTKDLVQIFCWYSKVGNYVIPRLVLARLRKIFKEVTTVEAILAKLLEHRGLVAYTCDCEGDPDYNLAKIIAEPVHTRLSQLVAKDKRRHSMVFLLGVWRRHMVGLEFPFGDNFAKKFMPKALSSESNLETLLGWYNPSSNREQLTTWNDWDHNKNEASRAVEKRILAVAEGTLSGLSDHELITALYYKIWRLPNNENTVKEIDKKLADVVKKSTDKMKHLQEVIAFRKGVACDDSVFTKTEEVFLAVVDALLPHALFMARSAEDVDVLIGELYFGKNRKYAEPSKRTETALEQFVALLPEYFATNQDILKAVEWYRQYKLECLIEIIKNLISKEFNPENLTKIKNLNEYDFQNSDIENGLVAYAKERFSAVLSSMKESNSWFEKCIEKKEFFGHKKLFIQKANEFCAVTT